MHRCRKRILSNHEFDVDVLVTAKEFYRAPGLNAPPACSASGKLRKVERNFWRARTDFPKVRMKISSIAFSDGSTHYVRYFLQFLANLHSGWSTVQHSPFCNTIVAGSTAIDQSHLSNPPDQWCFEMLEIPTTHWNKSHAAAVSNVTFRSITTSRNVDDVKM
jgi:hypothetical protein